MTNGTACVVVLYHPDEEEILRNIKSYLPFVSLLIVIDNTASESQNNFKNRLLSVDKTIQYIHNSANEGIAGALNTAASLALQSGYSWLLTMDQDSFFDSVQAEKYFSFFQNNFFDKKDIAVVAPQHDAESMNEDLNSYSETNSVITSGSLIRLDIWKDAGGFDEKLIIDEVDHEYCYRVKKLNYKIIQVNTVLLNHRLGVSKSGAYFGTIAKRNRIIHSPQRVYFMVRNYLYVRKKYRNFFLDEFKKRDRLFLTALKNNLFFSGQFMRVFKNSIQGLRDFRKENFSKKL